MHFAERDLPLAFTNLTKDLCLFLLTFLPKVKNYTVKGTQK